MTIPITDAGWGYNYTASTLSKEGRDIAAPGKFVKSNQLSSTSASFTGSNFGAAGIIIDSGATGKATFIGGGEIDLADLTAGVLYEFSLDYIELAGTATIFYTQYQPY